MGEFKYKHHAIQYRFRATARMNTNIMSYDVFIFIIC